MAFSDEPSTSTTYTVAPSFVDSGGPPAVDSARRRGQWRSTWRVSSRRLEHQLAFEGTGLAGRRDVRIADHSHVPHEYYDEVEREPTGFRGRSANAASCFSGLTACFPRQKRPTRTW